MYSIELDCPPGQPRPGDLLPGVLKDTGVDIDPNQTVSRVFGNWVWVIPGDQNAAYEKARETVKQRIIALYNEGIIRYGSW